MKAELIKKALKIIIFWLIFITLFCVLGEFFNPSGTMKEWFQSHTIIEFYKQRKNSIDVLYVGNSCIYSGVSPMEVYRQTGITGYALSTPGQKIWVSYYFIKEALKKQNPKLVIIEVGELFSGKNTNNEMSTRRAIDSLKFSKNKIKMINDSDFELSNFDKLGCIFPIIRYHTRWSSIDEFDFRKFLFNGNYTEKGFLLEKRIKEYSGVVDKEIEKESEIPQENIEEKLNKIPYEVDKKVEKIIKLCEEKDIQLIFIKFPEPKIWNDEKHEIIKEYAKKKNIKFYDLNYDGKLTIDWEKDTQDGGEHLNIYGAEKVAQYLSEYLLNNYKLDDHRDDIEFNDWNQFLKEYDEFKNKGE